MIRTIDLRTHRGDPSGSLPRAAVDREAVRVTVREIIAAVRAGGDEAVIDAQARFGERPSALRVSPSDIQAALTACSAELRGALEEAAERIRAYHERQAAEERAPFWEFGDDDIAVGEETRPVARAGCYVPGGRAAYPSTVLMTSIPARIAGVASVVVCAPPGPDGAIHPATLAACSLAGVDEVYAVGGAQAIAALAYGTESIARVDVICGPGNIYVTVAKHEVAMDVGVDGFAGPTEVAIVADNTAPAAFVAADLVAQAEHDPLATALLITPDEGLVEQVRVALEPAVAAASRSTDIESALRNHGAAIIVRDLEHAMDVANAFAPEHLEIIVADSDVLARSATTAGAVFVGAYSPVALGDYIAGTNHVLPTAGAARFASPLRVATFVRSTAIVRFAEAGLAAVAPSLTTIANAEGLDAHASAVAVRLENR